MNREDDHVREIIERHKHDALADFDAAAFAARLRRRLAADASSGRKPAGGRLLHPGRRVALCAAAILVVGLVIWIVPFGGRRNDLGTIDRVLAGSELFRNAPLDRPPAGVAERLLASPERDLAWSIQALCYRSQRREEDFAKTILAALAGPPREAPATWPPVDPDALARRIAILSGNGTFSRVFKAPR